MPKNYTIIFKGLRSGLTYTLAIGGGTGTPLQLSGASSPFVTQEFDDDDEFAPIRTQSGYIRIVDDGKYYDGTTGFGWKDLLPMTDTSRPVTLTRTYGQSSAIVWQGFMQSQNFSGRLYGNPQVRELPIQCPLTILEGEDVNYAQTRLQNFAYLLQRIVNVIDVKSGGEENASGVITTDGMVHIENIYIQGGSDAQAWLLKKIDWQNFAEEDADGNLVAKYNLYQCLEDMCRYWGWTARTNKRDLYLTCADDAEEQSWLTLSRQQLDTMAAGTAAGDTTGSFSTMNIDNGDYGENVFATIDQDDTLLRGVNKATVDASINNIDEGIVTFAPDSPFKDVTMSQNVTYPEAVAKYSTDVLTISTNYLEASAVSGKASFNLAQYRENSALQYSDKKKIIRVKKTYNGTDYALLTSTYEHCFSGMLLRINGYVMSQGIRLNDSNVTTGVGNKHMYVKLGIGHTRATAKWFSTTNTWVDNETSFKVTIGNDDDIMRPVVNGGPFGGGRDSYIDQISVPSGVCGKVFFIVMGSDDIEEFDGERELDIQDLQIAIPSDYGVIKVNGGDSASGGRPFAGYSYYGAVEKVSTKKYVSRNQNNAMDEVNIDCIYSTFGDDMNYGYGILINPDGTFMTNYDYGHTGTMTVPEQHLADRVTTFWATSRRRMALDLRSEMIGDITPKNMLIVDSTKGHPIAISHDWHDDVTRVTLLDMETN